MKTRLFLLIVLALSLVSCEQKQIGVGNSTDPIVCLGVVKFTDDKYREFIIAEKVGDDDTIVTMRGQMPPLVEELILGSIPYSVKLPNGYWVIDWRWGNIFIYRPSNVMVPYKWESLIHWNQTWHMPDKPLAFDDYIDEFGVVSRRAIDLQLGLNLEETQYTHLGIKLYRIPWVLGRYVSVNDIPDEQKDLFFNCVHEQDSLHPIYVQRLIEITNNGDFNKVYYNYY